MTKDIIKQLIFYVSFFNKQLLNFLKKNKSILKTGREKWTVGNIIQLEEAMPQHPKNLRTHKK